MWIRSYNKFWNSDDYDNAYVELESVVFEKHLPLAIDGETFTVTQSIDMTDYEEIFEKVLPEYEYKYQRWMCKVALKIFDAVTEWIAEGSMKKLFVSDAFVETLLRQCIDEEEKEYNEYIKNKSNS